MAVTRFATNDALAVKQWSNRLAHEALKATEIAPLIGTGQDSIIQRKTELQKQPGDQVTYGLRVNLTGDGVTEGTALEGNEESLTTYSDAVKINELMHAVRVAGSGSIDSQRIPFSMRAEAEMALRDWYAKRFSVSFFAHVCGIASSSSYTNDEYTVDVSKAVWNANNAIVAPTATTRHLFSTGSADETVNADSSATFDLSHIDNCVELAKGAGSTIPIRPIMIGGKKTYVIYLHPYQVTSMRTSTSTGQWLDIQRAALQGGKDSGNPIFTGALGVYNNVVIREANDVCPGVHSSTNATQSSTRRAVFLGAQAASIAFSKSGGPSSMKWVEEMFDYDRELGISVQTNWGLKKCVFNSVDFGSIVVSTYAAAAT